MAIEQITNAGMQTYEPQINTDQAFESREKEVFIKAGDKSINIGSNELTEEEAKVAAEELNRMMARRNTNLKFDYYSKLKQITFSIVDEKTGEVLREVPSKRILEAVSAMMIKAGLIVDKKI